MTFYADDRRTTNIGWFYLRFWRSTTSCYFMTYERHEMPESADEDTANLSNLFFLTNLSADYNFGIFQRRFHRCSMISKANYLHLLFCQQKQLQFSMLQKSADCLLSKIEMCQLRKSTGKCRPICVSRDRLYRTIKQIILFYRSFVIGMKLQLAVMSWTSVALQKFWTLSTLVIVNAFICAF